MPQDDEEQRRSLKLGPVFSSWFSFDGERLLAVPHTLTVRGKVAYLWDVETGEELQRFEGHAEPVRAVTFSPDGKHVLTGSGREEAMTPPSTDNSVRLWDLATGREIRRFEGHKGFVHTVRFSPDGKRLLTAGSDSTARVWDVDTGEELFVFSGVRYLPPAAAFSPDGRTILGRVAGKHRLILWDAKTGQENCRIERDQGFFNSAEFSPNGKLVLTASSGGTARTWDGTSGRQVQVFEGHTSYVNHAAFSADGQRIITASSDATVRLWDANTGGEIRRFDNPGPVRQVILSGDGKRFFAKWRVDANNTVKSGVSLWNATSGHEIMQVPLGELGAIVGFSPDGKTFLVVKNGKYAGLWNAQTGEIIRQFNRRAEAGG